MNRRTRFAQRTPLRSDPQRTAEWVQASRTPIVRTSGLPRVGAGRLEAAGAGTVKSAARTGTGFSRAVKLAVRTRAGNGDPDQARCEATGVWLGRYGGEIQHRDARGMGGTSDPVTSSIVNAVLLSTGAHRLAESRDEHMNAMGFWLRNGEDPALTPIMLHSEHGSGVTVWLGTDGQYHTNGPQEAAA